MREEIYRWVDACEQVMARAWLSTDSSGSADGQPVIEVQIRSRPIEVLSWADILPSGLEGWKFLERLAAGDLPNRCELRPEGKAMLDRLLRDVRAWRGVGR